LTVVGNVASNSLITTYVDVAETYVPELRVISVAVPGTGTIAPDLRRSDHARFWDANMQALMLTDASEFRNFNYHTPGDSTGTLDFDFMKNVVKATVATAAQLAVPISASHDDADLSTLLGTSDHHHKFPGELSIFPNPSDGIVSIKISAARQNFKARLEVFAISGQQVHREILNFPIGTSTTAINLQKLPAGSYIMHLHSPDATTSASIVMER
jgi:hypothetical protein